MCIRPSPRAHWLSEGTAFQRTDWDTLQTCLNDVNLGHMEEKERMNDGSYREEHRMSAGFARGSTLRWRDRGGIVKFAHSCGPRKRGELVTRARSQRFAGALRDRITVGPQCTHRNGLAHRRRSLVRAVSSANDFTLPKVFSGAEGPK